MYGNFNPFELVIVNVKGCYFCKKKKNDTKLYWGKNFEKKNYIKKKINKNVLKLTNKIINKN